ncbi:MAG: hypothetical protein ACP5TG_01650 [Thermoplasmata archaeon]
MPKGFTGVSIKSELFEMVDSIVKGRMKCYSIEYYRSASHFIEIAIEEKLERCNYRGPKGIEFEREVLDELRRVFGAIRLRERIGNKLVDAVLEDGTVVEIKMVYQGGRGAFRESIERLALAVNKLMIVVPNSDPALERVIKEISEHKGADIKIVTLPELKAMPSYSGKGSKLSSNPSEVDQYKDRREF